MSEPSQLPPHKRIIRIIKELYHDPLLNEEVYFQACDKIQLEAQNISDVTMRGKNEPVTIYALWIEKQPQMNADEHCFGQDFREKDSTPL
ncbi:MAG TPA: hypothetical protein VLE49_01215 [Anaerolineales bacterium]|nr:hypothetical protein [Anaerolineales bacterium]